MGAKPEDLLTYLNEAAGVLVAVSELGADMVEDTGKLMMVRLKFPGMM